MKRNSLWLKLAAPLLCLTVLCSTACNASSSSSNATTTSQVPEESGKRIYLAGPMFAAMEKDFNLKITNILEKHNYTVFLPQRDGYEAAMLEGKTEQELVDMIFEKDVQEVLKADICFMNLDGRVPDEGACVELGIAYANKKRCYGIKTDTRSVEKNMDLNPLIAACFTKIFFDYDGDVALKMLDDYLSSNAL